MFKQDKYKTLCENIIRKIAKKYNMIIRELFVMPEHVHVSVECPPSMSHSKALQLLKGACSYYLFRKQPTFRLRYPQGHFWSPGACATSTGYNTIDIVDNYVRNQSDIHQRRLDSFFVRSPGL